MLAHVLSEPDVQPADKPVGRLARVRIRIIAGLEVGAGDYLPKTFSPRKLLGLAEDARPFDGHTMMGIQCC